MSTSTTETLKQKLRLLIKKLRDQIRMNKLLFAAGIVVTIIVIGVGFFMIQAGELASYEKYISIATSVGILGSSAFCIKDIRNIIDRITGIELLEIKYLNSESEQELEKASDLFDTLIKDYLSKS
ncbi:MAG TPA: hypothetical protein VJ508_03910 [Saprospiraceae bacterium]|nr:hypothetical protein [Saprospiraceae bacterium]